MREMSSDRKTMTNEQPGEMIRSELGMLCWILIQECPRLAVVDVREVREGGWWVHF